MKDLSSYFAADNVAFDIEAHGKDAVLRKAAELLSSAGGGDASALEEALLKREELCSTGLGEGVAAPHVLLPGLSDTLMAFVRVKKKVDWKSQDRKPVRLVFAMIGPAEDPTTHLRILSRLTRFLRSPKIRSAALSAESSEELASAFRQLEKE